MGRCKCNQLRFAFDTICINKNKYSGFIHGNVDLIKRVSTE